MLVLSRKPQETIVLDGRISITVVEVRGNQVRLGIQAPKDVSVRRQELPERSHVRDTSPREIVLPLIREPDFRTQPELTTPANKDAQLFGLDIEDDSATAATL